MTATGGIDRPPKADERSFPYNSLQGLLRGGRPGNTTAPNGL